MRATSAVVAPSPRDVARRRDMNRRLVALVQARDYNAAVITRSRQQIAYLQAHASGAVNDYQEQQAALMREVNIRANEIHELEEVVTPGVRIERGPALSRVRGAKAFLRSAVGRLHQVDEQIANARAALEEMQAGCGDLEDELVVLREKEEALATQNQANGAALIAAEEELVKQIATRQEARAAHAAARDASIVRLTRAQAALVEAKEKGAQERVEEEEILATIEAAEESQRLPEESGRLERLFVRYQGSIGSRQDLEALLIAGGASRESLVAGRLEMADDIGSLRAALSQLRKQRKQARHMVRKLEAEVEALTLQCRAGEERRAELKTILESLH